MQYLMNIKQYNESVKNIKFDFNPLSSLFKNISNISNKIGINNIISDLDKYLTNIYDEYVSNNDTKKEVSYTDNKPKNDTLSVHNIEKVDDKEKKSQLQKKMLDEQNDSIKQLKNEISVTNNKIEQLLVKIQTATSDKMEEKYRKELAVRNKEVAKLKQILKEEEIILKDIENIKENINNKDLSSKINPYTIKDFFIKKDIIIDNANDKNKNMLKLYWDKQLNKLQEKWYNIFDIESMKNKNSYKQEDYQKNKIELSLNKYIPSANTYIPPYKGLSTDNNINVIIIINDNMFLGKKIDNNIYEIYGDLKIDNNIKLNTNLKNKNKIDIKIGNKIININNKGLYPIFNINNNIINDVKFDYVSITTFNDNNLKNIK